MPYFQSWLLFCQGTVAIANKNSHAFIVGKRQVEIAVAVEVTCNQTRRPSMHMKIEGLLKAAVLKSRLGQFAKAVDDHSESILRHPSAGAFYSRGWNYERLQKYSKAIADLQKSLEMDPNLTLAPRLSWKKVHNPLTFQRVGII